MSLLVIYTLQFLKKFEGEIIQSEYPSLSTDKADRTIKEPLTFAKLDAALKVACDSSWRRVVDQKTVNTFMLYLVIQPSYKNLFIPFRYPRTLWISQSLVTSNQTIFTLTHQEWSVSFFLSKEPSLLPAH